MAERANPVAERVSVQVEGRHLSLSNMHKVLYPESGFTKGEMIHYYTHIAPVLLPHLAGRPLTIKRYPNGVAGSSFFEKNAARGTPDWVRTVTLPVLGSTKDRETINFIVVEELATLVWLANLAAIELHVPQWRVTDADRARPADVLVFDLDPGEPADIRACCEVALWVRDALATDGLTAVAKTSGSKGMQISAPVSIDDPRETSRYAQHVAQRLEAAHPTLVVSRMAKNLRAGKIFVDWSQNNPSKTTVAPYSLRARALPTVSTPVSWAEVASGPALRFTAPEVLARVADDGDIFAATLSDPARAPLPDSRHG